MSKRVYGAVGYEGGRQCPFTPSTNASWIEKFNSELAIENNKNGTSRNKLTETLIQEALEARFSKNILIDVSTLTNEEQELLQSPAVQKLVIHTVKNMFQGVPSIPKQVDIPHNEIVNREVVATEEIVVKETETVKVNIKAREESTEELSGNAAALARFKKTSFKNVLKEE